MSYTLTEVMMISKCKYTQKRCYKRAIEKYFHLFYITGGKGDIYINDKKYIMTENEIFFCFPGLEYDLAAAEKGAMYSIEVDFAVNDKELIKKLEILNIKTKINNNKFKSRLEELIQEALEKPEYFKEIINIRFTDIMIELLRINNYSNTVNDAICEITEQKESNNQELTKVLQYIKVNFVKEITLKELSNVAKLNSAYLCTLFKKTYNISPIQYVNKLRLNKSKELITYSNLNITQVSNTVGFQSVHYFSRYFKSKEKISPKEFKQHFNKNIHIPVEEKILDEIGIMFN
jgi:AraC-like DNA-binding protein